MLKELKGAQKSDARSRCGCLVRCRTVPGAYQRTTGATKDDGGYERRAYGENEQNAKQAKPQRESFFCGLNRFNQVEIGLIRFNRKTVVMTGMTWRGGAFYGVHR